MNGLVIFNGTAFASEAKYVCNEGFELNGSSIRTCQPDEQWSESEPTCEGELLCDFAPPTSLPG